MKKFLFKEEQKFTRLWILVLMTVSFLVPLFLLGNELANSIKKHEDDLTVVFAAFLSVLIIGGVLILLFSKMKLVTEIGETKIAFKFPPLIRNWKIIEKEEIERFEVRQYKPIQEYGGWGIKATNPKNKAYHVRGNVGLQFFLKNGNKILIGTQKKQTIEHAMNKIFNKETGI